MKPIYENIQAPIGSSFYYKSTSQGCIEPFWHIHPEYELVYIHSGTRERHVGTNVSWYTDGALILIGSNIPHSTLGNRDYPDNVEVIFQMGVEFVENNITRFPELRQISDLFKLSAQGISFSDNIKKKLSGKILATSYMSSFERFMALIEILDALSKTKEYTLLNAQEVNVPIRSNDYTRINLINAFVAANYGRSIKLSELANLTNLTESSFSRFFNKVTGKSFTSYLNEYRIHKATELLSQRNTSITEVMLESGFSVPAHFTRTFKKYTNYTPTEYRKKLNNW